MQPIIDELVEQYDSGTLSRRKLLQGLTLLAAAGGAAPARAQQTPFVSTGIDHISIQVEDAARSIEFYQRIFGLSVLNQDDDNRIYRMGQSGVIVSLHEKAPTGIVDHYAITIDGFDRDAVTRALGDEGLETRTNLDYGFHVIDPEGIPVQIMGG